MRSLVRIRSRYCALLAVITVIWGVLRFAMLDVQSFWSDESITVVLTRMGFADMLHAVTQTESTSPLYYIVAWVWTHVFRSGEVGLRSLSAVAGTFTVRLAIATLSAPFFAVLLEQPSGRNRNRGT